jgi:phosphoserine phosphatase RsbU/P
LSLNPFSRSLSYSNAGHGPGYVFNDRGDLKATLDSTGIPLGINPHHIFHNDRATMLDSGDLILLMTDGIFETCSAKGTFFCTE